MITEIFEIKPRGRDLYPNKEMWVGETYAEREAKIVAYIMEKTFSTPHVNMKYIREIIFKIKEDTTIDDLKKLAGLIKEKCVIDCFQITINRRGNIAHLLFDWYDYKKAECFYLYDSYQLTLSVLILRELQLPIPNNLTGKWIKYFIQYDQSKNPTIFNDLMDEIKHLKLKKKKYIFIKNVLEYTRANIKK